MTSLLAVLVANCYCTICCMTALSSWSTHLFTKIQHKLLPVMEEDGGGHKEKEVCLTGSITELLDTAFPLAELVTFNDVLLTDDLFLPDDCKSARLTNDCEINCGFWSAWVDWTSESDVNLLLFLWRSRRLRLPRLDVSFDWDVVELTAALSLVSDVTSLWLLLTLSTNVLSTSTNHVIFRHHTQYIVTSLNDNVAHVHGLVALAGVWLRPSNGTPVPHDGPQALGSLYFILWL